MRRWIIVFILILGFLFGGYYLFQNISKNQSSQQQSNSKTSKPQPDKTIFEEKTKEAVIPKGQEPFFGIVTNVKDSIITIQSTGTTKTLTVKLHNEIIYSGGKQSDITKDVKIAGIGKTNEDGSITAVKLEIKSN